MNLKTRKTLALINIVLAILIFMDYFLPGRIMHIQELDSFYNTTVKIYDGNRPSFVDRKILLLTNGETFRLGKIPKRDYEKGQKIQIVKSSFTNNIKEIIILGNTNIVEEVGILSYIFIHICLIISMGTCLLNLIYNSRILYILLVIATMFTFIFSIGYLFK
jgi:hypothetical protein